jgi:hypothetical protein
MLSKLWWEIDRLEKELSEAPRSLLGAVNISYCAFNAAVTALHCADWAWQSREISERQLITE